MQLPFFKRLSQLTAVMLVLLLLVGCASQEAGKTVRVASKDFTEQFILGEMYALLLEDAGYTVERKLNLGATPVAHESLLNNQIDLYPEYTGTGLLTVLGEGVMSDPQAVFDRVSSEYASQFNLVWLDPAPMNNTQALAMTRERAAELGITTFSDMVANADQLVLIGPPEFAEREDGIPGLKAVYGDFEFANFLPVDPGLRYQALLNGEADVVVAFGTDGELAAYDLISLEDDQGLYPPYQVAPVVRAEILEGDDQLAATLNKVAPLLTNEVMQRLNNEVSGNGREPVDVAREFLLEQGLISE